MKDRKHEIKTDCSKKMRTPKTMLIWYDSENQVTYHYLISCNRNYHNNYRKLASYHVDMKAFHAVATAIGALDDLTRQRKDDCTLS